MDLRPDSLAIDQGDLTHDAVMNEAYLRDRASYVPARFIRPKKSKKAPKKGGKKKK